MANNNLLTFASAAGALVESDAAYASDAARLLGFQNGIADPSHVNKVWRQGAFGSAALGQLVTNYALVDANDDGNVAGFLANVRVGIAAMMAGVYYAQDTSTTANAIVAACDPAPPTLTSFRSLYARIANTNTGPVTIALNTIGAKDATRHDGTALQPGDLLAGQIAHFLYDQNLGQFVMAGLAGAEVPRVVTSPVLYVRPDGNDANDGSINTAAKAFQTIAAAVNYGRARYFLAGQTLTIQLGLANSGIYAPPGNIDGGGATITIVGDVANQGTFNVQGNGPSTPGSGLVGPINGTVNLRGVTVTNTSAANHNVAAAGAGTLNVQNTTLATTVQGAGSLVAAVGGGSVAVGAGNLMTGAANAMLFVNAATMTIAGNITIPNSVAYTTATAAVINNGTLLLQQGNTVTANGTVNAPRYFSSFNGVINMNGSGANFFPGSSAGSTSLGGVYA